MKHKYKSKPSTGDPGCPYSKTLRWMPPLHHLHPGREFHISHSDVVLFILLAMGLYRCRGESWSKATVLFNLARKQGLIAFNPISRTWQGESYGKGDLPPRIRSLVAKIRKS